MAQRVLISGKIGTGKTVLAQHFGLGMERKAQESGINLRYVHVNCRECRGSLFMILQRVILSFHPGFPRRGYSAEELLQMLLQTLDESNAHLILALDELETLIRCGGSNPLYNLTRIQEDRLKAPQRLSLLCILREPEYLGTLDSSTRSTLQRNLIHLGEYSKVQLVDILNDRVALAFAPGTVSPSIVDLLSELAASEGGDARYAIDLLWRAGKYADSSEASRVLPEFVRKAAVSLYPVVRREIISSLSLHEKMFLLGIARRFKETEAAYISMGEAEDAYAIICEGLDEKKRGHTQIWKYVKELSALGIIKAQPSGPGKRGKTTLISLMRVPASDLEQELSKIFSIRKDRGGTFSR